MLLPLLQLLARLLRDPAGDQCTVFQSCCLHAVGVAARRIFSKGSPIAPETRLPPLQDVLQLPLHGRGC